MIYSLKGKITRVDENIIAVDNNGVEFEVCCSLNSIDALTKNSGEQKVYTYLQVREDGMFLFGFSDLAEKRMFLNLISKGSICRALVYQVWMWEVPHLSLMMRVCIQ